MNRAGWSSNLRFTEASIKRLKQFRIKNFSVGHTSFTESIPKHPNAFLYLDPPYVGNAHLYAAKRNKDVTFDHYGLREVLQNRKQWLLSYSDHELMSELYADYRRVKIRCTHSLHYGSRVSHELLILSDDLEFDNLPEQLTLEV